MGPRVLHCNTPERMWASAKHAAILCDTMRMAAKTWATKKGTRRSWESCETRRGTRNIPPDKPPTKATNSYWNSPSYQSTKTTNTSGAACQRSRLHFQQQRTTPAKRPRLWCSRRHPVAPKHKPHGPDAKPKRHTSLSNINPSVPAPKQKPETHRAVNGESPIPFHPTHGCRIRNRIHQTTSRVNTELTSLPPRPLAQKPAASQPKARWQDPGLNKESCKAQPSNRKNSSTSRPTQLHEFHTKQQQTNTSVRQMFFESLSAPWYPSATKNQTVTTYWQDAPQSPALEILFAKKSPATGALFMPTTPTLANSTWEASWPPRAQRSQWSDCDQQLQESQQHNLFQRMWSIHDSPPYLTRELLHTRNTNNPTIEHLQHILLLLSTFITLNT